MLDTIFNGSKAEDDNFEYVNDCIKPNYVTYKDADDIYSAMKSYITSTDATTITANTLNTRNRTIDIEDIVTYKDLADEGDINKMYKLIFDSFCKIYPEKALEYKTLLKLYFMDYRRTVIAIDSANLKEMNQK